MTRRTSPALAVITALVMAVGLLLGTAGTASAESRSWADGVRDVGRDHPNITGVRLSNNRNRMFALTKVRDLSDRTALRYSGAELWIDTAGAGNPEFVIQTGLSRLGTDWNIFRANGWRPTGGPLNCDVRASFNYRTDEIKWSAGQGCLGSYGRIRVSATVSKNGRYDYSPARHRWHPYVARG